MAVDPFITLDNITVRIADQWVIHGLSWQISAGQNWVIWGANGAGKSTLAMALLGQAAVVQGRIHRHYEANAPQGNASLSMALVSFDQHQALYQQQMWLDEMAHFSGRLEMNTAVSEVLGIQTDGERTHRAEILHLLGLETLLAKAVKVLSAGEMRKLLIGRALLKQPRLLILDEPFNGLDAASQRQLRKILDQLGKTEIQMVLITHRPAEIPTTFTHLLHLENGSIRWQGPIQNFFEKRAPMTMSLNPVIPSHQGPLNAKQAQDNSDLTPLIQMRDVCVRYGPHQVLTGISWTVQTGENWALVGPNGAGKSTLLKLITGDNLQGYANELILFGRPKGSGENVWQIKQQIGYVADDLQLRYQKKMSGFDVVCSGFFDSVGLYRRCSDTQKQTARMWLEKTGTQDLAPQLFSKLSFGQQRMVLIVRAMVKTPRLLILDEPCNGLDAANRQRLLDMLEVIGRSQATSLLYVSHRPDEMPACITHQLHLEAGRMKKTISA